jgi:hypothetical protein
MLYCAGIREGKTTMRLLAPRTPTPEWPRAFDAALRSAFEAADPARYEFVFRYLLTSFADRHLPHGAAALHPGAPSRHGRSADAMEGFSRFAPLVAAWLAGGRDPAPADLRDRSIDLVALLRDGIVAGTTPGDPGYWGDPRDYAQPVVEAADVARALWVAREPLLRSLSAQELRGVAAWLGRVIERRVWDNNWLLFPMLVEAVLASLDLGGNAAIAAARFDRFMTFHAGDGWFRDGPAGRFDWYNAWAIHYELSWLAWISGRYCTPEIEDIRRRFLETLPYLISSAGIPIMGRSVHYRLAAPAPLVAAAVAEPAIVEPGLGRRALDAVWSHFVPRGAIAQGVMTQGYYGPDLRLLDNYSGPASPLWGTRALVPAFLAGPGAAFWTEPAVPLPIERGDFERRIDATGWLLTGDASTGDVRIYMPGASPDAPIVTGALEAQKLWMRLAEVLTRRPYRAANTHAKYELPVYSSLTPFCG